MKKKIKELIISSGGIKGISIIGVLEILNKYYPINKMKYYTGCSIGAIIIMLVNIGYTIEELKNIIFTIHFEIFQELKIINLFEKCGLDEGIKFTHFLSALMIHKNFDKNITFFELFQKTKKILTFVVSNITKGIPEYHNYITTPNMSILLSLRMSSNIPIIFSPIFYNNHYYIDGGLLDPFPFYYNKIKKSKKMGILLFTKHEIDFFKNNASIFISTKINSLQFLIELLKIIHVNYIKKLYKKINKNVIKINFQLHDEKNPLFNNSLDEKNQMYQFGIKQSKKFFKYFKKKFIKN